MDIILVPGLWLDASSWDDVAPALTAAGHRVHALTMPGLGARAEESKDIGLADWVSAVVERIDELNGPVVLVGHSGGGNVVWGAADARPDHVVRVLFVDSAPPAPGHAISEFDVVDGVIPFPGWDFFPDEDVADLTPEVRARTAPTTRSVPERVPTDPISLTGGRHRVPVTMLMGGMDQQAFEAEVANWPPFADEYRAIDDATVVRIGSGHWPQFSVPDRLAQLILDAVAETS
ncbi:alpha/beta fold hydrolase [Microbacterium sp. CIAB417]|uniref:alpha/beta fold hydrolase n=1 Tax=Microbacterium sp. CIAB417 TaxID=2860287 RepID=UPI001FAE1DD8|nr:alpha/beta hydrolase [Microbacterium sp. CIAB417]